MAALSDEDTIEVWQKAVLDSGGEVRPDKCYWSAVDFTWTGGKWRYKKRSEIKGSIKIRNPQGQMEKVKRYDWNKANEGLGVYITPKGCLEQQLKETSDKIKLWTAKVVESSLSQRNLCCCNNDYISNYSIHSTILLLHKKTV